MSMGHQRPYAGLDQITIALTSTIVMHPQFPHNPDICYLNHAAVSPWPKCTVDAVKQFAEDNLANGAKNYPAWLAKERQLRERLCRLLNADSPSSIALQKNTSEALSAIAYGLDWKEGDNVVLAQKEFPSNRIVWESLKRFGVETRIVDLTDFENPEVKLIQAMDKNTRLLTTSSVHYANGLRMDLQQLGEACKKRGVLFCIDAIQSLGAFELDVAALEADFVVADGHKWMLGPEGLAVFYCRPERLNDLKLHQFGWHMVENAGDYDQTEWQVAVDARRFECGSPNMLGVYALEASLGLIEETGLKNISSNISRNVLYLIESINNIKGVSLCSPVNPERRGGILTFQVAGRDHNKLHHYLLNQGVICAQRGGGIRFSPHFYNEVESLQRAVTVVSESLQVG